MNSEGGMSSSNSNDERSFSNTDEETERSIEEEAHFKKLFDDVYRIVQTDKAFADDPYEEDFADEATKDIKRAFLTFSMNDLDFNSTQILFAYFVRYSTLNTAISRHRFLHAIDNCEKLKTCLKKPQLNVISLGGGPGTDIVGFCSAIQERREMPIHSLNLCVVDKWKKWESFYDTIQELLVKNDYGNASTIFQENKICSSFLEVDLLDSKSCPKYDSAMVGADIVLLVRVLDSYKYNKEDVDLHDLFRNIAKRMREEALLIHIDCHTQCYENQYLRKLPIPDLEKFKLINTMQLSENQASESKAKVAVFVRNNNTK